MLTRLKCLAVIAIALILPAAAAQAQTKSPRAAAVNDPVLVFNEVCYGKVPDVQAIRQMATKLAWNAIGDAEVKKFTQISSPDVLEGWDAQIGERIFRVAIVQSAPPSGMVKSFPAFEKGKATTCSMVVDEGYEASLISKNMQLLARKDPLSKDVDEGLLKATTWAGGSDDLKVFLVSKVAKHGKGGLLSVTVLQK